MKPATASATALLVIDVQESFRKRPYWQPDELPGFIANVQGLIDSCSARGLPVLQVFHREPGPDPTHPFHPDSGLIRTLQELRIQPTEVFFKEVHSGLFGKNAAGVTLEQWLRDNGIQNLVVTGIRTEQCCETTTRHASDVGFNVQYASDATLTFPMQSRSGRNFSAAEIRERTELVLDGRFAAVVKSSEVVV